MATRHAFKPLLCPDMSAVFNASSCWRCGCRRMPKGATVCGAARFPFSAGKVHAHPC
jgi:hypothetical protein